MAFTGTATIQQISDQIVRITGLSLAAAASGTIGLSGDSGADVQLPDSFDPEVYKYKGTVLTQSDVLDVSTRLAGNAATAYPIQITKGGTPWRATLTNNGGGASTNLEIWVKYHD